MTDSTINKKSKSMTFNQIKEKLEELFEELDEVMDEMKSHSYTYMTALSTAQLRKATVFGKKLQRRFDNLMSEVKYYNDLAKLRSA